MAAPINSLVAYPDSDSDRSSSESEHNEDNSSTTAKRKLISVDVENQLSDLPPLKCAKNESPIK